MREKQTEDGGGEGRRDGWKKGPSLPKLLGDLAFASLFGINVASVE